MCVYTLPKGVSRYDLSVLSMSMRGFGKKLDRVVSCILFYFGTLRNLVNFHSPAKDRV